MKKINKVVSVCSLKDIDVWKVSAPNVLKFISASRYEVVVPNADIEEFRKKTPSEISVISEDYYLKEKNLTWFRSILPPQLSARAGWYLQQVIKILAMIDGHDNDINLIWDADTIPLVPLNFISKDGSSVVYYEGRANQGLHAPYFVMNKILIGLDPVTNVSFITQSFPSKVFWIKQYIDHVESFTGKNWIQAILENTISACNYSEYEALGNFILTNYKNDVNFQKSRYIRSAALLLGQPEKILEPDWARLADVLDYIAFETNDLKVHPPIKGLNLGCGNGRIDKTGNGYSFLNTDIDYLPWTDMELDITKRLPFPNGYFEHVVANNVLEHIDDVLSAMKEIDRVLQVGGLLQFEVPHVGSYNYSTDITHKKALNFHSFNFLFRDGRNYLFRDEKNRLFDYKLEYFFREIIKDGKLEREYLNDIPKKGTYYEWLQLVYAFIIPGTFGFAFRKIS